MKKFHSVLVNRVIFLPDEGFPTFGFKNAKFTLLLQEGKPSEFNWQSDANWVSVNNNGEVEFIAEGNKNKVTITATPKNGGDSLHYSFSLKNWFHSATKDTSLFTWEEANNPSSPLIGLSGYRLPTISELMKINNTTNNSPPFYKIGVLGALLNEWGNISDYKEPQHMPIISLWTSEKHEQKNHAAHYIVNTSNGAIIGYPDTLHNEALWIKVL